MLQYIRPKHFFLLCLVFFAGSLMNTDPRIDDDFLGEQVYWLIHDGHVRSEFMSQYNGLGFEHFQAVYHKLFIWTGAVYTSMLGWGLFQLHLVSLTFLGLFLWGLWRYLNSKSDIYPKDTFWWITGMMLIYHESNLLAFTFRPEVMVMAIGFASWFFLEKCLAKQQQPQIKNSLLAGFFAGLAMLTHLNGLIFIFAGCAVLLLHKKIQETFLFGIAAGGIFLLYFVDILYFSSLDIFFNQFTNDPVIQKKSLSLFSPFEKLLDEHYRLFLHTGDSLLSITLIVVLLSAYKFLRGRAPALLYYTLFLMLGLAVFANYKTAKYMVLYLPFVMLLLALGIGHIFRSPSQTWLKNLVTTLIIVFAIISFADIGNEIYLSSRRAAVIDNNKKMGDLIPDKNATIITNGNFIFNEIKRFPHLVNFYQFTTCIDIFGQNRWKFEDLIAEAIRRNARYIVFDEENYKYFDVTNNLRHPGIKIIINENETAIIEIEPN